MGGVFAGADERGAGQNKGSFSFERLEGPVRGDGLGESVQTVGVVLQNAAVMNRAGGDCFVSDRRLQSGGVDFVRRIIPSRVGDVLTIQAADPAGSGGVGALSPGRNRAFSGTEIGSFVHVDPKSVDRNELVEAANLVGPPGDGGRIEEVREVDGAGPDLGQVRLPIVFDEDVFCGGSLVDGVGGINGDARVN